MGSHRRSGRDVIMLRFALLKYSFGDGRRGVEWPGQAGVRAVT